MFISCLFLWQKHCTEDSLCFTVWFCAFGALLKKGRKDSRGYEEHKRQNVAGQTQGALASLT